MLFFVSYLWFDIKLSYMKRAVSYLWFDIKLSYMKRAVAQLVEHLVVKSQEGGGSKPSSGTLFSISLTVVFISLFVTFAK